MDALDAGQTLELDTRLIRREDNVDLETVTDLNVSFCRARKAVDDQAEYVVEWQMAWVCAAWWWELVLKVDLVV